MRVIAALKGMENLANSTKDKVRLSLLKAC